MDLKGQSIITREGDKRDRVGNKKQRSLVKGHVLGFLGPP